MPVTPRDQEQEGAKTRSQTATDDSAAAASTSTASAAATTAASAKPEFDLNAILILLKEESRAQEERFRAQEEQSRIIHDELRSQKKSQEEQSRILLEVREAISEWKKEMTEVQGKLADMDIKFENRLHGVDDKVEDHEKRLQAMRNEVKKLEIKVTNGSLGCETSVPVAGRFKVPPFDGTSSWTAYKLQFESVSQANGWNKDQAKTALTLALRDEALAILEALGKDRTYDRLLEALEARYGDSHLEHVFRAQLKDRAQGRSESIQQWALEIEKLVRKAYQSASASFVDSMLVQAFIDGIRDLEVRAAVRLGHHGSLKDAVALVRSPQYVEMELCNYDVKFCLYKNN